MKLYKTALITFLVGALSIVPAKSVDHLKECFRIDEKLLGGMVLLKDDERIGHLDQDNRYISHGKVQSRMELFDDAIGVDLESTIYEKGEKIGSVSLNLKPDRKRLRIKDRYHRILGTTGDVDRDAEYFPIKDQEGDIDYHVKETSICGLLGNQYKIEVVDHESEVSRSMIAYMLKVNEKIK